MPSHDQVHNGKLLQYADDTALISNGGDYCEVHNLVTTDLQYVSNRITSSKMQLNIAKSSVSGSNLSPSIAISIFLLSTLV